MEPREHLPPILERELGAAPASLAIAERPLRGGLEGSAVTELTARFVRPDRRAGLLRVVAKHLRGPAVREPDVYERLVSRNVPGLAPRILHIARTPEDAVVYMAAVARTAAWPWGDLATAARVLLAVAPLHESRDAPADVPRWDYEDELRGRADATLERVERARRSADGAFVCESVPALRRLVLRLPGWREALLSGPLAPCAIHGDLHTGNALPSSGAPHGVVLFDWARARVGSPLEDVCSWLQSLAFWEPAVRRRHDTLLRVYLSARGIAGPVSAEIRDAYWLAGASNALAGALAHHLDAATCLELSPRLRAKSRDAARDWLRIVRRADASRAGRAPRPRRAVAPL